MFDAAYTSGVSCSPMVMAMRKSQKDFYHGVVKTLRVVEEGVALMSWLYNMKNWIKISYVKRQFQWPQDTVTVHRRI